MTTHNSSYHTVRQLGSPGSTQIVWDDLQINLGRVRAGSSAPTWRAYNYGIGGGVNFDVLGFTGGNSIFFDIQTTHSMKLSTILDTHIHYITPTDGTGDRFQFQLDVIAAAIDANWAVASGSPFTAEHLIAADYSNTHKLFEITDIPAVNTTVSTLYKCELTRIAATADEYGGEIYVDFIDCHYQKDMVGSLEEASKS